MAAGGYAYSYTNFYDQPGFVPPPAPNSHPRDGRDSSASSRPQVNHDDPPFSRVFVVCSKSLNSDDLRAVFEKFGIVEDVWVVKDRQTKESRGVAYIKFSKMSEATLAVEEMDGKPIDNNDSKPIKAIIAKPKSSKSTEDFDDATALTRLFIVIPKKLDEPAVRDIFEEYGEVDYVQIVKDRRTREPKGFGYVNFKKPYFAALALEGCDKSFRAVMAEPKSARLKRESVSEPGGYPYAPSQGHAEHSFGSSSQDPYAPPAFALNLGYSDSRSSGGVCNRLQVNHSPTITQDQLARLFDLIPGMELCDLKKNYQTGESKGIAFVVYNSIGASVYAKEKLNGFEYPPGYKLSVRYAPDDDGFAVPVGEYIPAPAAPMPNMPSKILTTAALPAPKPFADPKAEVAERLFIVCTPNAPNDKCLKDVFSRFGDLIDVYMLKNKNFGYAKYATKSAAVAAMETLNGEEIMGVRVKVLPADPPKSQDPARKRPRT